jgi:hypothetical protein
MPSIKPSLLKVSAGAHGSPPPRVGTRYDRQGRFLPEPGNTVVSHLVPGSAGERAVLAVRDRIRAMPDAASLAITPPASLHMTLFQGIIEYRREQPYWPADVAADTPIDAMTELYLQRLQGFQGLGPFAVKVIDVTPFELTVAGATDADVRCMQAWRDALSGPFGYRHPDHNSYRFHITLGYMIDWLADDRLPAWASMLDECLTLMQREAPVLQLQPPAFCRFHDMERFEELLVLR